MNRRMNSGHQLFSAAVVWKNLQNYIQKKKLLWKTHEWDFSMVLLCHCFDVHVVSPLLTYLTHAHGMLLPDWHCHSYIQLTGHWQACVPFPVWQDYLLKHLLIRLQKQGFHSPLCFNALNMSICFSVFFTTKTKNTRPNHWSGNRI